MTEQQEFLEYVRKRTDKYNNPTNTDEITEELRECKTLGEVKNLTERVFPEWFVTTISKFSVDYPQFQQNWEMVCKKIGVKPLEIMIVEDVEQGPDYTLVQNFAECFTRAGFCVRKKMEFFPCEKCGCCLPSQIVHKQLVDKGFIIPEWKITCQNCN
jgi:hypothetical protein